MTPREIAQKIVDEVHAVPSTRAVDLGERLIREAIEEAMAEQMEESE